MQFRQSLPKRARAAFRLAEILSLSGRTCKARKKNISASAYSLLIIALTPR